jgi:hypothetical protein
MRAAPYERTPAELEAIADAGLIRVSVYSHLLQVPRYPFKGGPAQSRAFAQDNGSPQRLSALQLSAAPPQSRPKYPGRLSHRADLRERC